MGSTTMLAETLTLLPSSTRQEHARRGPKRRPKGRIFEATLVCQVVADHLWKGGEAETEAVRPVYLRLAAPQAAMAPFLANFRRGHKAAYRSTIKRYSRQAPTALELLRTADYHWEFQQVDTPAGRVSVATAHLTHLFYLEPARKDPNTRIRFLLLPPADWVARQARNIADDPARREPLLRHAEALGLLRDGPFGPAWQPGEVLAFAPIAGALRAYLDRRTTRPSMPGLPFALQLTLAALVRPPGNDPGAPLLALPVHERDSAPQLDPRRWSWAARCLTATWGLRQAGLMPPLTCDTDQATLDSMLVAQTRTYATLDGPRHSGTIGR